MTAPNLSNSSVVIETHTCMDERHTDTIGFDGGTVHGTGSIKIWTHLSLSHIYAAAHLARLSKETEDAYAGTYDGQLFAKHRSYVLGSVLLATAALEATINELFLGAIDGSSLHVAPFKPEAVDSIKQSWNQLKRPMERRPILEKYQTALKLTDRPSFDTGKTPYRPVDLLINLRNDLMHYKPKWVDGSKGALDFENALKAVGFSLNPMMPNNPFFPDQCLSHGCANWAFESSLAFIREFNSRMGIASTFREPIL